MSVLETIAAQTFSGLMANLASGYITRPKKSLNVSDEQLKTDLQGHFEATYTKCTKIRTILNEKPIDLLSVYVDQTFQIEERDVDQYDVVEKTRSGESCIITGTGGGGKSVFMRYLWLSYFVKPDGKIPFFLELRQLNTLTHDGLEDFIFHSIIRTGSSISQINFSQAISQGEFILFLDGFDEINHDRRNHFEREILSLNENNPNLTIIVTSRPDPRFIGWHMFHTVTVEPLQKEQVIELIERAEYAEEAKSDLLKKINGGLYDSHKSFLSNPLLAYMMLVTISYSPNISKRMFYFYEQAFEALYHRHDLTKGGYQRKFHCELEKHAFIRLLSYFCLVSYHSEKYEFTEFELMEYCSRACGIESVEVDVQDLMKDMIESVCLLKLEGLEYSFTHRSFQEYFAANCIARVASKNLENIFQAFAHRYNDQVLEMVFDIHPDLFQEKYIVPLYKKYKSFFERRTLRGIQSAYLAKTNGKIRVGFSATYRDSEDDSNEKRRDRNLFFSFGGSGDFFCLHHVSWKLRDRTEYFSLRTKNRNQLDIQFFNYFVINYNMSDDDQVIASVVDGKIQFTFGDKRVLDPHATDMFKETTMYEFLTGRATLLLNFVRSEKEKFEEVSDKLGDLF